MRRQKAATPVSRGSRTRRQECRAGRLDTSRHTTLSSPRQESRTPHRQTAPVIVRARTIIMEVPPRCAADYDALISMTWGLCLAGHLSEHQAAARDGELRRLREACQ
jgi:hypothetical protein